MKDLTVTLTANVDNFESAMSKACESLEDAQIAMRGVGLSAAALGQDLERFSVCIEKKQDSYSYILTWLETELSRERRYDLLKVINSPDFRFKMWLTWLWYKIDTWIWEEYD